MSHGSTPPKAGKGAAAGPAILSPRDARRGAGGRRRAWWLVLAGVGVVVVGVAAAVLLTQGGTTTSTQPVTGSTCPLTGESAPGGVVPPRPALAIKIGNYPSDRPSEGLNQADIVFEEPIEGAITRLVAVFQCQAPALVGDVRSAREPDVAILSQLSDPIFAHAGGIDPVLALLADAPLIGENVLGGTSAATVIHPAGRYAPYSTFVEPHALWALEPSDTTPPAPLFTYAAGLPKEAVPGSGSGVHIPFSSSSNVTWQWDPSAGRYLRHYSGTPDMLVGGTQTVGGEQRGVQRGGGGRHRLRAAGGHGRRGGHHRDVEPIQPHPAGHADRVGRYSHHPEARQHVGGAGAPWGLGDDHGRSTVARGTGREPLDSSGSWRPVEGGRNQMARGQ